MTGSYVTHDGGKSWQQFNLKNWVKAFAFDPSHPDTAYAGATGLYHSEDAGDTWHLVFPNPAAVVRERTVGDHADHSYVSTDNWPGGRVEAINVDPGDSRRIWIGVNCGTLQLFSSSDCGESWVECGQVEGGLYRLTTADYRVERLPVPSNAEVFDLACGLGRATGKPVLYITTPTA